MSARCDACQNESISVGVISAAFNLGQKCYEKAIDKDVKWGPETPFDDLLRGIKGRYPKPNLPEPEQPKGPVDPDGPEETA